MSIFRPSGDFEWVLKCSAPRKWHLYGCIGPETRSIEVPRELHRLGLHEAHQMLCVREHNSPFANEAERLISQNTADFTGVLGSPCLVDRDLLASVGVFSGDVDSPSSEAVILDVSAMPKRFFFYYLKRLLQSDKVKNLLLTYCSGKYAKGALSGNPDDWAVLPTFRNSNRVIEDRARTRLAVNVGFMPDGLQSHLGSDDAEQDVFLLLPFPARVSSTRRVWKSAMQVHNDWKGESSIQIHRVAADDISGAFDLIHRLADGRPLSLAPFGPKPISAAMCIYASLTDSPVYYAQPKWYSPTYTTAPHLDGDGKSKIAAYWIKHEGKHLYAI